MDGRNTLKSVCKMNSSNTLSMCGEGLNMSHKIPLKWAMLLAYCRFTWVFFLATKDETSRILISFIIEIENIMDKKVKIIICDNGTEFKNRVMNEFCKEKGIKREFSIARTPQQNRAEAVNTACYVHNMVLVVKPHFKTPYELFRGRTPALSFMRPFGCHVTILNTLDHLGKFDGKSDEGFFVGYSINSKAFRVYNTKTRKLFDIDTLTESINYVPVIAGTNSNDFARKGVSFDAGQSSMETGLSEDYILMTLWNDGSLFDSSPKDSDGDNQVNDGPNTESEIDNQERPNGENSTKDINIVGPTINTASSNINTASPTVNTVRLSDDFFGADNDMRSLDGVELDKSNISTTYPIPTTPMTRINKDHFLDNVISNIHSGVQTRRMTIITDEQGFISAIYEEKTHEDLHTWFDDLDYPDKVYKVEKALYGLHQAPRAWYEILAKYLLGNGFRRGKIDQTLFIKRQKDDIQLVQVYVDEIIFRSTKKELCTEFEFKYEDVKPANTQWIKKRLCSKIQIVMMLMFISTVKRNFRYLKGHPKLGLWGPKDSSLELVAYTDSDYARASLDRKSTSGGCQFLGCILISWQCKKKTVVATSTTEAEYVAAASCCGQGDSHVQARPERLSNLPNKLPLGEGNTSQSGEGIIQLLELMAICTKLLDKVTHLENELTSTKVVYNKALITLTKRVKKLEKKLKNKRRRAVIDSSKEKEEASLDHEDSPKQGRMIEEMDKDENVNLVKSSEQGEAHETAASPQVDDDETLTKTLLNIKRSAAKYKGKSIMQESKSPKKFKKKEMMQISLNEEVAQRFYEEEQARILRDEEMLEEERKSLSIKKGQDYLQSSLTKERRSDSKAGEGSSKAGESQEELGQEQKVEEEIAQQEDVVAKQAEKKALKSWRKIEKKDLNS
uniref:Uncharacterized protein n=1 Tax=Tanacetum cinerariifolium TaxID=118510 RepID=A0A6L2LRR6_TANCI|nr:hypothetical protein [Tanacetum cinerariifolium]